MKEAGKEGNPNFEVEFDHPKHPTIESIDAEEADQEGACSWNKEHWLSNPTCSVSVELPNLLSPLEQ